MDVIESHASAVSLLNSGEQRYIKAISIDQYIACLDQNQTLYVLSSVILCLQHEAA